MRHAQRLRELLHRLFARTDTPQQTLAALWPPLTNALRHSRPEGLPIRPTIDLNEPADLTAKLALLALQFLSSEDARLVKACADQECGWLFLDRSRHHSRRWCSSNDCGNRNRVRRHYQRQTRASTRLRHHERATTGGA